jgi:CheY-like chemotaxis protein
LLRLREAAAEGSPYPLVLLDLHMPEMDGLALARAVQADPRIPAPAFVVLASFEKAGTLEAARALGIERWLRKPVRSWQLREHIAAALAGAAAPTRPTAFPQAAESARPRASLRPAVTYATARTGG